MVHNRSASNGSITIIFYLNDTFGNLNSSQVIVKRDGLAPLLTINTPTANQQFEGTPPTFTPTIVEGNNDTWWYTIDGGLNNYIFFGTSGTINSGAWGSAPNGSITIIFYVNDTFGNLNSSQVSVKKDVLAPAIMINSPTSNQLFMHILPQFNLTIIEGNLNVSCYTIDGGLTNYTFIGMSGTINQGVLSNGTTTIRFYANDTFGNLGYSEVTIQFDKLSPKSFTLSTDADSPDTDGIFNLNWTISIGADNYSIYMYSDVNGSVTLVEAGITDLGYLIAQLDSGTYYFIVRSYNATGFAQSNQVNVTVEVSTEEPADLITILTNPVTIFLFGIAIVSLAVIIKKFRKKYYKSGDKEIKRIEDIRRKETE